MNVHYIVGVEHSDHRPNRYDMAKSGWIRLHRRFREHDLWTRPRTFSRAEAWIDLLMEANWQDKKLLIGLSTATIKRGEIWTSQTELAKRWRWSRFKTQSYIALLRDEKMISAKASSQGLRITILNYERYQDTGLLEQASKKQQTSSEKAGKHIRRRIEEREEVSPPIVPPKKRKLSTKSEMTQDLQWLESEYGDIFRRMRDKLRGLPYRVRHPIGWLRTSCRNERDKEDDKQHDLLVSGYRRDSDSSEPTQIGEYVNGEMEKLKKGGKDEQRRDKD